MNGVLYVTGKRSTIVTEFEHLYRNILVRRVPVHLGYFDAKPVPEDCERLLLCAGVLHQKRIAEQSTGEICNSLAVNLVSAIQLCEAVLNQCDTARICLIGSESGFKGSYDTTYAVAKAGLHKYVETRAVGPRQQLVAIAPSIIWDSGMTQQREDLDALARRAARHPRQRFLYAAEVSKMAHFLLYEDEGYTTNTVIRMHGGVQT